MFCFLTMIVSISNICYSYQFFLDKNEKYKTIIILSKLYMCMFQILLSTIIKDTEIKVFSYDYILWSEKKRYVIMNANLKFINF